MRNKFTIIAALRKDLLRMSFLKVSTSDLAAGDLCRDRQDGNPAAVAIIEAVDQVQISGTAAPGAYCQRSANMRIRSGGEGRRLFVPYVDPLNVPPLAY